MSAGSKRRALAIYFSVRIWYMISASKCGGDSDLGLCTTSGLAKEMPLRCADFRQILRQNMFFNLKSAPRSRILFTSPEFVVV